LKGPALEIVSQKTRGGRGKKKGEGKKKEIRTNKDK